MVIIGVMVLLSLEEITGTKPLLVFFQADRVTNISPWITHNSYDSRSLVHGYLTDTLLILLSIPYPNQMPTLFHLISYDMLRLE